MMQNPLQQTTILNQEMKNPHLVETMVVVEPITGRRIQNGYSFEEWIDPDLNENTNEWKIYQEKMSGNIPRIEVTFNIQGIPLVLTAQSYLTIRLTPKLMEGVVNLASLTGHPLETNFEINRNGWPKINSQVIDKVQATISNMGTEAYYGFYLNYIRSLRLPSEVRENMMRQFNVNQCIPVVNTLFQENVEAEGNYQTYEYRNTEADSHLYSCSIERVGPRSIQWTKDNAFEIRIPLSEILPVFQIPVLPLAQTNTSGIQLRMILLSPRHMFYISKSFNSKIIWNNFGENNNNFFGLRGGEVLMFNFLDDMAIDNRYNGIIIDRQQQLSNPNTVIAYDRRILESIPPKTNITSDINNFFSCDLDVDVFLNLKVLSNPLLNPLAEAYIQPFINEMNEFRAKFETSALFNQIVDLKPNIPSIFRFTPSRLFYNATQIGLFFFTQTKRWTDVDNEEMLNSLRATFNQRPFNITYTELDTKAGPIHGYYSLPPTVEISDFQIGLSSSATPLFDRPLDKIGMLSATEDCFKKYNPSEMYGKILQNRKRLSEGDAFFVFDLTHTRDSGYFIDADNLITVGGTLTYRRQTIVDLNEEQDITTAPSLQVQVIMVVFYQETFTVLLDLEGSVLFQQT